MDLPPELIEIVVKGCKPTVRLACVDAAFHYFVNRNIDTNQEWIPTSTTPYSFVVACQTFKKSQLPDTIQNNNYKDPLKVAMLRHLGLVTESQLLNGFIRAKCVDGVMGVLATPGNLKQVVYQADPYDPEFLTEILKSSKIDRQEYAQLLNEMVEFGDGLIYKMFCRPDLIDFEMLYSLAEETGTYDLMEFLESHFGDDLGDCLDNESYDHSYMSESDEY